MTRAYGGRNKIDRSANRPILQAYFRRLFSRIRYSDSASLGGKSLTVGMVLMHGHLNILCVTLLLLIVHTLIGTT